jgi:hypothetical protein
MSLFELQKDFGAWLRAMPIDVESHVGRANTAGLAVYRHAYRAQLAGCLRETYAKTLAWIGDDAFDKAADAHIDAHPPHAWTLGEYGREFDQTLASRFPDDPEIAELAWLDWRLRCAFDGADASTVDAAALGDIDWDQALFRFVPTLCTRAMLTNCAALWHALNAEETPPPAESLAFPIVIRIWRNGFSTRFRSMEPVEAHALAWALAGESFGNICARLVGEDAGNGVQTAGAILRDWLADGLIASIGS